MKFKVLGIEINIKKDILGLIIALIVVTAGIAVYVFVQNKDDLIIDAGGDEFAVQPVSTESMVNAGSFPAVEKIQVYVTGCVKNPGVVTLEKGQIIADAIEAAGGVTDEADVENINLVYKLTRNVMIKIKSRDETSTSTSSEAGPGLDMIYDSGGAIADHSDKDSGNTFININTASVDELRKLPGIGEQTAKSIVEFRNENGDFERIEDIMKVPGIKESKFNAIKDFITVD